MNARPFVTGVFLFLALLSCGKDIETPQRDNPFDPVNAEADFFGLDAESRTNGVMLSWNLVSSVAVDGYRVYRGADSLQSFTRIADSLTTGSYFDGSVLPGEIFYYKVSAFAGADETSLGICHHAGPNGLSEWLVVDEPSSTTEWTIGDTVSILWSSFGTSGRVAIEISTDGGSHWSVVTADTEDDGAFEYIVPGPVSSEGLVRIMDKDGSPRGNSSNFSVIEEMAISVSSPSTGLAWVIGNTYDIKWATTGLISEYVSISLTRNGADWETLFSDINDDGEESWQVTSPTSWTCQVMVRDPSSDVAGYSGTFAIVDSSQTYVSILSPSAGEDWLIGDDYQISWQSNNTSGTINIGLSRDAGSTWEPIEESAQDDGGAMWTVTGPPGTSCYIRIADVDGDPTGYSGEFAISNPVVPALQIISPTGEAMWEIDTSQEISWTSVATSGTVAIDLSRNSGATWETVGNSVTDDDGGAFSWVVTGPPSTACMVRVSDIDGEPSDTSEVFTVFEAPPESIMITVPGDGDEWEIGSMHVIQWSSANTSGSVRIQISRDAAESWDAIDSNTEDDGAYAWIVQGPASESCMVRIADSDGAPADTSGEFAIEESQSPYISIREPSENTEWGIGTHRWVEWDAQGTSGLLDIRLSRNGGTDWEDVVLSTADDGSFWWPITGPASSSCLLLVRDADGDPSAESNFFSLVDLSAMRMVALPGGSFQMGHDDSLVPDSNQSPEHYITVSSFEISKYEITQLQYASFDPTHQSQFEGLDNNPVEKVSWFDAARFCNWLSGNAGYDTFYNEDDLASQAEIVRMDWEADGYRLPTEAEWEYACRAGTQTDYYHGIADTLFKLCEPLDPILDEIGWYCGNAECTRVVGVKIPNAFGLYDMSGNVFEWCNDWYLADYYENSPSVDPRGPESGSKRVRRGGSYYDYAYTCTSAFREDDAPGVTYPDIGFRVVRPTN